MKKLFQLTKEEILRCQIGTSSWGGKRYLSYVFTEQGVAMLSTVLNSKKAIIVNIAIMRAFVKLRGIIAAHKKLAFKLAELEEKVTKQGREIISIFEVI